ncbi:MULTISPECIES: glycoside hydrolase [Rhodomicrobium]|uniref:WD40/YVTN/BNR-like repeat-containing protein n=1 Tax=Rhodomicrobium TaxID=1068 RepID=UPI000B4B31CE|nr:MULTISPECIES: glycoside hydrolase [Rhodomicrobium]
MASKTLVLIGTKKGAFVFESDAARRSWDLRGPFNPAWPINHVIADPETGTIYAGGGNEWFGPAVWKSTDLGETWTHSSEGLAYAAGETPVKSVWSLAQCGSCLYAGVEPAGLFRSEDGGESWSHVSGLRDHPTRPEWHPGGAGLILHSIVTNPNDDRQIWVAMSSVGVFHSSDRGESWEPRNRGTRNDYAPDDQKYPEFGQCVHSLVMAANKPERLYQQNHCGMYRSDDGGREWQSIEAGLPSTFGFPAAAHPSDPETLYLLPLNGDQVGRYMPDAKAAVWRTRDGGKNWQALRQGLPQENAFFGVLRQAMATDKHDRPGVYFGTSGGQFYASADEGESWTCVAEHLPPIYSVETLVMKG